jgi:hypothetical protein
MIAATLQFTADLVNEHVMNSFQLDEHKVAVNYLIHSDGSIPNLNQNKVVLTLIAIEKESVLHNKTHDFTSTNRPEENYNVTVLFTCNFDDYSESLKFLDALILFFQKNSVVTHANTPRLPSDIDKLTYEFMNVSMEQSQTIWTTLGAKYQPSVLYKIRGIKMRENSAAFRPVISSIE